MTPYTDYEVKVKTITSSAYEDSEILGFSTQCTPASLPYYEPFAGLTTLPTNWRINVPEYAEVVTEVGNGRLTLHNTVTEVTQNIYGYTSTYTSYSQFGAYTILPYFNNLGSLQLSFKAGRTQGTMESLSVGVVADPNNYTDYTEIGTATLTDNANGEVYSYNLVNNAVQSGHIVIRLYNSDDVVQSIWLDDFYVQQYAAPTGPVVSNVTNTSATLGWTSPATEWEVRYGTDANNDGAPIAVTDNPTYTITGLTASTDYIAQVRAKYGENLYSEWVSFPNFTTYYSAPISVDKDHTYSFGFQRLLSGTVMSSNGGWQLINKGLFGNDWMISDAPGTLTGIGNEGTNYSLHISYNGSAYQYLHRGDDNLGNDQSYGSTVYATRVFTLAPGSYQFSYRWKCKGIHESDYFRVALVPANTVLTASDAAPEDLSYNNLPTGWIALDGGEALNPMSTNYGFDSYTTPENARIPILEGGDYMMVFVWHNISLKFTAVQNPPVAIDNVSVTWSSLVYPPAVAALHDQVTDNEAPLALYASEQGITPTSYEVQYEPAAAVNTYEGAPIATFNVTENPQTVTLTGLTPLTLYSARVRSVYTANGHSVYSDWQDCPSLFTTLCTPPTNLVVVGQTSSWANVMWTPVEMTLPSSQSIHYEYQLTTDQNNWDVPIISTDFGNNSCSQNFAPGTYYIRVRTYVEEYTGSALLRMGESDWSEPITFTIAPWTDPVSIFPLAYGFDEGLNRFADGITLGGDITLLNIVRYDNHELQAHGGGASTYTLAFGSDSPCESHLVLPPLNPSTSDALVSFWWYHDNAETDTNVGVVVEYSNDGSTWQSNNPKITRYADETGWAKYQQVVPAIGSNATYVRLRFVGPSSYRPWAYCFLDDLTVHTLKSEQPYISYVGCGANSATITLYDYAVENGYYSSAFQVQYREWRDPSETQETWVDYDVFVNQEPYTFENTLTVNGLQPATCYEFRARARVSFGGYDFDWSGYCEPVRQWTDCGTYTITPSYSYTEDFEELFNGTDCWTGDIDETAWHVTTDDAHSGTSSLYCAASGKAIQMPEIDLTNLSSTNDNVVLRFWANNASLRCRINVYVGSNEGVVLYDIPKTNGWRYIELSLSSFMGNVIRIEFVKSFMQNCYIDELDIVANPYPNTKIFDKGSVSENVSWNDGQYWYPTGVPTINDDVRILGGEVRLLNNCNGNAKSIVVGAKGQILVWNASLNVAETFSSDFAKIGRNNNGITSCPLKISSLSVVNVHDVSVVDANSIVINGVTSEGVLNITGTLTPGAANSVVVNDGGVLYAGSITGTSDEVDNTVVVEDGGQLRLDNPAYVTLKKNIGSYTDIEAENNVTKGGYYLISSPLNTNYFNPAMAGACTSDVNGADVVWTYDLYAFDYEQELEWRNYKVQNFLMRNGRGYLYANRDGVDLSFAGPVAANNTQMPVSTNYGQGSHYDFNGWTLVGNPMTCNAYVSGSTSDMSFFRMNPVGNGFIAATGTVAPMEGIFVYTEMAGQAVLFNRDEPTEPGSKLGINLMQGNTLVDNAIIRFGQGGTLPKFSFSNNTSKVYIPMADDDYAVVSSQPVGVLPLNFEAAKDGTYTLSFEDGTEGLLYCHLIDNKTGADVDLLATPDYSFNAKADDYASRFKVVFVANGPSTGSGTDGSETFAFYSNGTWIIANPSTGSGPATLQVIDLNGRILSSEQINGCAETHINAAAGIYIMRLVNGENVRTQKIIVK